jgi:hypothetical protein
VDTAETQRRLGEILLAHQAIDEVALLAALTEQESSGRMLGEIVVALGLTSSGAVSRALAEQKGWSQESFRPVALAIPAQPVPLEQIAVTARSAGTKRPALVMLLVRQRHGLFVPVAPPA